MIRQSREEARKLHLWSSQVLQSIRFLLSHLPAFAPVNPGPMKNEDGIPVTDLQTCSMPEVLFAV